MNEEKHDVENRFYERCAELLGVPHIYKPFPFRKRTRWNNRTAGNGRFEGFGLIRIFGPSVHIALTSPIATNRWFKTHDDALSYLAGLKA